MSLSKRISPVGLLVAFMLIVSTAIVAIVAWHNWNARRETLARAERNVTNLANSLAQHAARSIEEADLIVSEIVERVENGATSFHQLERLNRHMAERVRAVPPVRDLVVLDHNGYWLASSWRELATHNNADREYFQYHRDNLGRAPRIHPPILSRGTGRWTILISRRFENSDGTFAGVVLATIDTDYFQHFYDTFNIGKRGTISLLLRDGKLLVRHPYDPANFAKDISNSPFFHDGRADSPSGFFRNVSPYDGVTRLAAHQKLPEFPVIVWVALAEDEVLAPWRSAAWTDALVAGLTLVLIGALGTLTIFHLRRRQQLEEAMAESERRYRLLADNAADMVVLAEFDGTRIYVSPSVNEMLGYTPDEYLASNVFEISKPEDHRFLRTVFELMRDGSERQRLEYQLRCKDGNYIWVETTFKRLQRNPSGPGNVIAVVRDISSRKAMEMELQDANVRLRALASTDALTGIANRRSFDLALEQESRRCARSNLPLSVLLIDIDKFKAYNDHFGHSRGDVCLHQVAQALNRCTKRPGDVATRYGGEEFAIILPETDEAGAEAVAEAALQEIAALKLEHPESPFGMVTISVGFASVLPAEADEADQVVKRADMALYRAKGRGRNQAVAFSSLAKGQRRSA
jgi:diguanylate cyclase (GGDEF)-like protein/PAS domain S-box-containing protein